MTRAAAVVDLGKGQDAGEKTAALASGKRFPLTVLVTNQGRKPLVIAQAAPSLVIAPGDAVAHVCQTRSHLYDLVFGMIAVGDRLAQDTIGSVTTKLPKEASK